MGDEQKLVHPKKPKVMLVDDEKDILQSTTETLERSGYDVHGFDKPLLALEHVRDGCKQCGVLVSDFRMPGMSGFELIRLTKEVRPDMKVILMSVFELNLSEFRLMFPSTRIEKVLTKPFTTVELTDAIKSVYSEAQ